MQDWNRTFNYYELNILSDFHTAVLKLYLYIIHFTLTGSDFIPTWWSVLPVKQYLDTCLNFANSLYKTQVGSKMKETSLFSTFGRPSDSRLEELQQLW